MQLAASRAQGYRAMAPHQRVVLWEDPKFVHPQCRVALGYYLHK